MKTVKISGICAALFTLGLVGLPVASSTQGNKPKSEIYNPLACLSGLTKVLINVVPLSPDIEKLGLTKADIQTDAELQFREAGIKVIDRTDPRWFEASRFSININIVLPEANRQII